MYVISVIQHVQHVILFKNIVKYIIKIFIIL
jgi:hypothetical protein